MNLTTSTELHCFMSNIRVVYLHAYWRKSGAQNIISSNNTLHLKNVSFNDTGYYVCFVQYQTCGGFTVSNTSSDLTNNSYGTSPSNVIRDSHVTNSSDVTTGSNVTAGSNVTKGRVVIRNLTRTVHVDVQGSKVTEQLTR